MDHPIRPSPGLEMNSEIARTILVPHFVQVRFIDVKAGERLCSECAKLESEMFGVNSDKEDRVKGLAPARSHRLPKTHQHPVRSGTGAPGFHQNSWP